MAFFNDYDIYNQPDAKENKERIIQGKNGTSLPDSIKSEVNFLVLPFFALWDKDIRNRTKTEYRTVVKRGQEKFEVLWRVTSDPEYAILVHLIEKCTRLLSR